jgi:crossover junction endodeoxyribonuclease RuvC
MRILGVDPGSRLTGYGCIDYRQARLTVITHGVIKLAKTSGKQETPLEVRLLAIHHGLSDVIEETKPDVLVIERVFFAKNAVSALKLGQARGAAILSGMIHGLSIAEYSPSEVKLALVGQGHAGKDQVARMIELLVGKQTFETSDASDGLALAICHAYTMARPSAGNARSAKNLVQSTLSQGGKKGRTMAESLGLSAEKIAGLKRVTPDKMR